MQISKQQFSDDEGEADGPLAPLPDEAEVIEGDDEDQDDTAASTQRETSAALVKDSEPPSKLPSPKPHPLSMMTLPPAADTPQEEEELDAALKPQGPDDEVVMGIVLHDVDKLNGADEMDLDMSGLGPDGLGLAASHSLSQIADGDGLLGGPLMDNTSDPFAEGND